MKKFHIDHKNARKIMWVFYGLGALVMLWGAIEPAAFVLGALLMVPGMVVLLAYWRCPHCGMRLPSREGNIQYCPYCGGKL